MKIIICILELFLIHCNGLPISEWKENAIPEAMTGAIAGYYNDSIWILPPYHDNGHSSSSSHHSSSHHSSSHHSSSSSSADSSSCSSISMDVVTKKFSLRKYPTPRDYLQSKVSNSFTTVGDVLFFLDNNGGSNTSSTYLRAFSMKTGNWFTTISGDDYSYDLDRTYTTLPCLTSTLDGKYLIIMGGIYDNKVSDKVTFYDIHTQKTMSGTPMNSKSYNFGCIVASDAYLYKFGGSNYDNTDNVRGYKLDVSSIYNNNGWLTVSPNIDLSYAPQNPTILELEKDSLIYIIGGYSRKIGKCVNTVAFVNISTNYIYDPDYQAPTLIDAYCYGAGVAVDEQLFLFGGTEIKNGQITVEAEPIWQSTNNATPLPTMSPITTTTQPTKVTTESPTKSPTDEPTSKPTLSPTDEPTPEPTNKPTLSPSDSPTDEPTPEPTNKPTASPTDKPTSSPINEPTVAPTDEPTNKPTATPTNTPTDEPTNGPTITPDGQSSTHDSAIIWIILGSSIGVVGVMVIIGLTYLGIKKYKNDSVSQAPLLN